MTLAEPSSIRDSIGIFVDQVLAGHLVSASSTNIPAKYLDESRMYSVSTYFNKSPVDAMLFVLLERVKGLSLSIFRDSLLISVMDLL